MTTIQQGFGQVSPYDSREPIAGEIARNGAYAETVGFVNTIGRQSAQVTVTAAEAGEWRIIIRGNGPDLVLEYTAGSGDNAAAIAAGLRAAYDPADDLRAKVHAIAGSGAIVDITLASFDPTYEVIVVAPGSGTATVTDTSLGSAIPVGRVIVCEPMGDGASRTARLPNNGDTADRLHAVALRGRMQHPRPDDTRLSAPDTIPAGRTGAGIRHGYVFAAPLAGSAAASMDGRVYVGTGASGTIAGAVYASGVEGALLWPWARFARASEPGAIPELRLGESISLAAELADLQAQIDAME